MYYFKSSIIPTIIKLENIYAGKSLVGTEIDSIYSPSIASRQMDMESSILLSILKSGSLKMLRL